MKSFQQWLEWGEGQIRGEYWIQNGYVDFADGDVGDRNHEMIARDHIVAPFADSISGLAEDMELPHQVERHGEVDYDALDQVLRSIFDKLTNEKEDGGMEMPASDANSHIMKQLNCDQEAYNIICGRGDPREYAMKHMGWIAVRANNVELYGYDNKRRKQVSSAIRDILDEEDGEQDIDEKNVNISIYDYKTKKSIEATLEELESDEIHMAAGSAQVPLPGKTTNTRKIFIPMQKDREENKYSNPSLSRQQNPWNIAARTAGIGQELWRGTSESCQDFKGWFKKSEKFDRKEIKSLSTRQMTDDLSDDYKGHLKRNGTVEPLKIIKNQHLNKCIIHP